MTKTDDVVTIVSVCWMNVIHQIILCITRKKGAVEPIDMQKAFVEWAQGFKNLFE